MHDEHLSRARELLRSLPIEDVRSNGLQLDRVDDNPEAARYFLAYGNWSKISADEIFDDMDPTTGERTQVYVDFPFCPTVCNFCAFYGTLAKDESDHQRYVRNLVREMRILRERYFREGWSVETVELGGGTPTYTPYPLLVEAIETLFAEFPVRPGGEHNFEATPESIIGDDGFRKLQFLREAGFARLSIGAQSFEDEVLRCGNRPHDSKATLEAVENARRLEYQRINFDLLLGLPDQTLGGFLDSVARSVELGIEVIEIYTLRFFDTKKHVPVTMRLRDPARFLTADEILLARVAADSMLREVGYRSSNGRTYQRDDREFYANYYQANFQGANVLGLGRKSHSNVYPWQYANHRNLDKYHAHLDEGRLPIAAGFRLGETARMAKLLTGGLQLPQPIPYASLRERFGEEVAARFDEPFERFERLGLLERENGSYTKTFLGFLFVEEMLKVVFDRAVTPFNVKTQFLGKEQRTRPLQHQSN